VLLACGAVTTPAEMVKAPTVMLALPRSNVPLPDLVRPPVPDRVPLYAVEVLSPPVFSVAEPSVTAPLPASEPIVALLPFRSNVALTATVTALPLGTVLAAPWRNVPALIVVAAPKELAPPRIRMRVEAMIRPLT